MRYLYSMTRAIQHSDIEKPMLICKKKLLKPLKWWNADKILKTFNDRVLGFYYINHTIIILIRHYWVYYILLRFLIKISYIEYSLIIT